MQIENIVVHSIASHSTKLVQCVGVSTHEKASIGTKIRFSGKPDSSARVSTLINTKLHENITMCNINVQCTELQAALTVREHLKDFLPAHDLNAIDLFINKFSSTEIENARNECKERDIKIDKVLSQYK